MQHRTPKKRAAAVLTALVLAGLAWVHTACGVTISTDDGLSLGLAADARVTSVTIDGTELVTTPGPAITVRDLSAAGTVFTPNLIANGSFETDDGSGGAAQWSVYKKANAVVSIVTDDAADGTRSLFVETDPATNTDGTAIYMSAPIAVSASTRYRFSAQFRARKGYLALNHTAPEWQREIYADPTASPPHVSGIYVAWFANASANGNPTAVSLVAPMHTNARQWKRITGEAVAPTGAVSARVFVTARLLDARGEDDAIWVDDLSMIASPEAELPVTGTVTQVGSDLELTGTVPGAGLQVGATYRTYPDHIEVTGQVTDTTGTERALQLAVRLPVELSGYTWWDDIHQSRTVVAGSSCSNWVSADAGGLLPQSLYPLAVVEDGTRGLAAAVPLDRPRVVLLSYGAGALEARFHLGISPAATRLASSATFTVYIYRSDPTWGFRAALDKLRTFSPSWFDPARPLYRFEGFAQGNFTHTGGCLAECEGPCEACCAGAALVACYDAEGTAAAQYTAPEGPTLVGDYSLPPPSYDQVLAQLANPAPDDAARYVALAASLVRDGNGDYFMKQMTNQSWAPEDWLANWVLNMDPEIIGGYAQWTRSARVDAAFAATQAAGAVLDGIEFDNFMSAPAVDLDTSRFPLADHPLTYDPNTFRPGIHTMSATAEYLAWLRGHIDSTYGSYPGFSANIWGIGTLSFLAPYLEFLPNESRGGSSANWQPEMLDYRRTIAYHKPMGATYQAKKATVEMATRFANQALYYGAVASPGKNTASWEDGAVDAMEAARELVYRFWHLGWEPVTYARPSDPAVWVERFGNALALPAQGIYFTVHRWDGTPTDYTLTVDAGALGLGDPPSVVVKNAATAETLAYTTGTGTLGISGSLAADETAVLRLMGAGCHPAGLSSASITLRPGEGDDRLRVRGRFDPPPSPPDFTGSEVVFRLADRDGDIYAARVPPGGFTINRSGRTFRFKDRDGTIANGLVTASFTRKKDGSYSWRAKARDVDLTGADRGYVDVTIEVGTACWADMQLCTSRSKGKRLRCKPPRRRR